MSNESLPGNSSIEDLLRILCSRRRDRYASSCDQSPLYVNLLGHGFIVIFCLAMVGNAMNLLVYNSHQIRFYLAIRMLCSRLLMNTLTMFCLLPNALRILHAWPHFGKVDEWYWRLWPFQSFFGNVFGFAAMWLTVLMTAECFIHIFMPVRSKSLCTHKNLHRCHVIVMLAGVVLALIYPINRHASIQRDRCNRSYIKIEASYSAVLSVLEQLHTLGNLVVALVVPLALLVYMTISIVYRINCRPLRDDINRAQHFSSEKRCVTRITLITTILQFGDLPSVVVFVFVALNGSSAVDRLCGLHTMGLFLGLCNMSLSFYVYFAFSPRFRQMVIEQWQEMWRRVVALPSTLRGRRSHPSPSSCPLKYKSTGSLLSDGRTQIDPLTRATSFSPQDTFL